MIPGISTNSYNDLLAYLSASQGNPALRASILSSMAPSIEQSLGLSAPIRSDLLQPLKYQLAPNLLQPNLNGALALSLLQAQPSQNYLYNFVPKLNLNPFSPLKTQTTLLTQNNQSAHYTNLLRDLLIKGQKATTDELLKVEGPYFNGNGVQSTDASTSPPNHQDKHTQLKKKRVSENLDVKREYKPLEVPSNPAKHKLIYAQTNTEETDNRYPTRNKLKQKQADKEEPKSELEIYRLNYKPSDANVVIPQHMQKKDYTDYVMKLDLTPEEYEKIPRSRVGEAFQAQILKSDPEKPKRTPKCIWDCEKIPEDSLNYFFENLNYYLGEENKDQFKALTLLERFEYNIERTLENVRKNRSYYKKQLGLTKNKPRI